MRERSCSPALSLSEIQSLLANADYIDVKTVTGTVDLRTFIAGFFNYHPAWLLSLFAVRAVFVRFLRMRQEHVDSGALLTRETVPTQIGKRAAFLTVCMAEEGHYWFAYNSDKHLKGTLGVVVEPLADQHKRFHVVTKGAEKVLPPAAPEAMSESSYYIRNLLKKMREGFNNIARVTSRQIRSPGYSLVEETSFDWGARGQIFLCL